MKTVNIILFLIILNLQTFGQSLSVFDVDVSNFPTIKANFYAFDRDGNQITSLSPSDFEVKERGIIRNVTQVSCPAPKPPESLSSVLVIDISGSMDLFIGKNSNKELAKEAARSWVNGLPLGKSECAITTFDHSNYLLQDFTTDRNKLLAAIELIRANGGTDYNMALINQSAGGLQIAKHGKYKKVIVFLTDGKPNREPQTSKIISEANQQNVIIFGVTLGMPCPDNIKEITTQTGGQWFENVTTVEEARHIYQQILRTAQGGNPCEITWESGAACDLLLTSSEIRITKHDLYTSVTYVPPENAYVYLKFDPSSVVFMSKSLNNAYDTTIKVTAVNGNFTITDIISSHSFYTIAPKTFNLENGQSINLKITYTPTDSIYTFTKFEFLNNLCPIVYYSSGTFAQYKIKPRTLKLTHPNGGETFVVGNDTIITWEGIPKEDLVNIEYTTNLGKKWQLIDTARGLIYKWEKINRPTSEDCLVRIKQINPNENKNKQMFNIIWSTILSADAIDWSKKNGLIAIASKNEIIIMTNLYQNIFILKGHTGVINSISFNKDGTKLVSGCSNRIIIVWDLSTGNIIKKFTNQTGSILSVTFDPTSQYVASAGQNKTITIWDINSGLISKELTGHNSWVSSICFNHDGTLLASSSWDRTIIIWNFTTGNIINTITGHSSAVSRVSFSPDGTKLASASYDWNIKIWNTITWTLITTISGHTNRINSICFNHDGTLLASASDDRSIRIWNLQQGTEIKNLRSHNGTVLDVIFDPQSDKILSCSSDRTFKIWDVSSGEVIKTISGHIQAVNSLDISSDGSKIVSGSLDFTIKIWDTYSGNDIKTLTGHSKSITSVSFSPDGTKIASGSLDSTVKIWDVNSGSNLFTLKEDNDAVYAVSFSPDGTKIASGGKDNRIKIWDVSNGKLIRILQAHTDAITSLRFNSKGDKLVSGSLDKTISFWNVNTGDEIRILKGISNAILSVALNHDDSELATGNSNGNIDIWDLTNWKLVYSLSNHQDYVYGLSYNTDGTKLASASRDNTIKIWEVSTGKLIKTLLGHSGSINSLKYNPDGSHLFSASSDGTLKSWFVDFVSLQADISDNKFSIVEPLAKSKDIDMGTCFVNSSKDSATTDFIQNIGKWKFQVDSIYFRGFDANAFTLVSGFPEYVVEPQKSYHAEFRFQPSRVGKHQAEIVIKTQSDTLIQKITGIGLEEQIAINNAIIDFGTVDVGKDKDTLQVATIKNVGSLPITITQTIHSYPNTKDFMTISGGGSFTLQSGETKTMDLRFRPSEAGRTSGNLEFHYNGPLSPAKVQLFGEGVKKNPKIKATVNPFKNIICEIEDIKEIDLSNYYGGEPLIIKQLTLKGNNANEFEINEILPIIIEPDSNRRIAIKFKPRTAGQKEAELEIISNADPDSVLIIPIIASKEQIEYTIDKTIIDLGVLCKNEQKDIPITFTNTGTIELGLNLSTTQNVKININKLKININETMTIPITFNGISLEGNFNEQILIIDTLCGIQQIVTITGVVLEPKLLTNDLIINSIIGSTKEDKISLYNSGMRELIINEINGIIPPFYTNIQLPITLQVGEVKDLTINYSPITNEQKAIEIEFIIFPCNLISKCNIIGVPFSSSARLKTIELQGYVNDEIKVPIILDNEENLILSEVKSIDVEMEFNPTLLYPMDKTFEIIDDKLAKILIKDLPVNKQAGEVLSEIPFKVGLGNADGCELTLSNAKTNGGQADITLINGWFKLLGICNEGGARLINPNAKAGIITIAPNPANNNIEIELSITEHGLSELLLFNTMGELVKVILRSESPLQGIHTLQVNTNELSTGQYFLQYRTPTYIENKIIKIVK